MAGLLGAIGKGIAGGARAAENAFAEQLKQQAMEAREMNLLRIQEMFADKRQQASYQQAKDLQEAAQIHSENILDQQIRAQKGMHTEGIESAKEIAFENREYQKESQDKLIAAQRSLAILTHGLKEGETDEITKKFNALTKIVGPEKATNFITELATGKNTTYEYLVAKMTKDMDLNTMKDTDVERVAQIARSFAKLKGGPTAGQAAPGKSIKERAKERAATAAIPAPVNSPAAKDSDRSGLIGGGMVW